jgi:RHS repeat-associated protein
VRQKTCIASLFSYSILLLALLLTTVPSVRAQKDALDESGFKAFGSYQNGDIDHINMVNLKPTIVIPLLKYPQRGSLHFGFNIVYHPPVFTPDIVCPPTHPDHSTCTATYGAYTGVTIEPDFVFSPDPESTSDPNSGSFSVLEGQGVAQHTMRSINATLGTYLGDWLSSDGTAIREHFAQTPQGVTALSVTDAAGVVYPVLFDSHVLETDNTVAATDPNGNTITAVLSAGQGNAYNIVGWKDSVGRYVPYVQALFHNPVPPETAASVTQDYSNCTGSLPTTLAYRWDVPGEGGGTVEYKVCFATLTFTFPAAGIPNCQSANCGPDNIPFQSIQSIVLPNKTAWTFDYDQAGGFADLKSVTLPTGGTITYSWGNNTYCSTTSYGWYNVARDISSRTVDANDGLGPLPWTYQQSGTSVQGQPITTSVTDPMSNVTVHTLTPQSGYCALYETKTDYYQGSSTLLKSVATSYSYTIDPQSTLSPALTHIFNVVPQTVTTTLGNGSSTRVKQVLYTYDSGIAGNQSTLLYGQVVRQQQTDFGSGSPGPMLRQVNRSYLWQSNSSYQNANLIDFPCLETTYGAGSIPNQPHCTAPAVQANQAAQTQHGYDENNGSPQGIHGNDTSVTRWLNGGTSPRSQTVFTSQGMPQLAIDPLSNTTTTTYDSSGLFPSSIARPATNGVNHTVGYTYDLDTGLLENQTDENGNPTSYGYDDMWRVKSVTYPADGGAETYNYSDTAQNPSFTYTRTLSSSPYTSFGQVDGLGRKILEQVTSDPAGTVTTKTTYDKLGRVASVTNPYRSTNDPTYGFTYFTYDALGRKTIQKNPDNSTQQWCYEGVVSAGQAQCAANQSSLSTEDWQDFYDETGRHWQRVNDGLGRLTAAMEPITSTTPNFESDYGYDALGNLREIDQWGGSHGSTGDRIRTFVYDTLSRLTNSCNPESIVNGASCTPTGPTSGSWSDSSTYDADGNIKTRVDARGVTTTYTYDALNRIAVKAYTNDPLNTSSMHYFYDTLDTAWGWAVQPQNLVGRLAGVNIDSSPYAWIKYGYDTMGRINIKSECLPSDCGNNHHDLYYKYNYAGDITFYDRGTDLARNNTYPNQGYYFGGFNVAYDTARNVLSVTSDSPDANHPAAVLSNAAYTPFRSLSSATLPGTLGTLTRTYNKRGWYTGETLKNSSSQQLWNSTVGYATNGSVNAGSDNAEGSWTYLYGNVNRLAQAVGPSFTLAYTYDNWSNRTSQLITSGSGSAPQWSHGYNTNNRQASGLTYDAAGNVTYDGFHTYTYDAENRIHGVDGTTTYVYDGENNRVATYFNGTLQREFLYDYNGRLMTELNTNLKAALANIYVGSELFAEDAPDSYLSTTPTATMLRITDQVGTLRSLWDIAQHKVASCTSLPYGDAQNCSGSPSDLFFTGKQRDLESGNDYFGARYYSSTAGRFMSPDWSKSQVAVPYADTNNPQSLNLYGYTKNDPLTHPDADGHTLFCGQTTISTNTFGDTVVNGNCVDLPDTPSFMQTVRSWYKDAVVDPWNARIAVHAPPASARQDTFGAEEIAKAMMIVAGAGWYRYKDVTGKSSLIRNMETDAPFSEAGDNLKANGFTERTAPNGTKIYTNGDTEYSLYPRSSSGGVPSAQVSVNGEAVAKIRFVQ